MEISNDLIRRIRADRARSMAVTAVPSTPRHMPRDTGGVAVSRGAGRYPHLAMETLRETRERSPLIGMIHQARQYQMAQMARKWDGVPGHVGLRVVHKDHRDWKDTPPEGFQRYIDRFEGLLWKPAPDYNVPTLGVALSLLLEDYHTINRPVVELIPSMIDPTWILQWRPVDGGIIWETLQWIELWQAQHPRWAAGYDRSTLRSTDVIDLLSQKMDIDLHGAEYVLVREGQAEAVYPRGRLMVGARHNRTDIRYVGYPPSHVEQAIGFITTFGNVFSWNSDLFTRGFMAEFALGIPGDLHPDDMQAFVDMLREATQGRHRAWAPPMIPLPRGAGDIQKIDFKPLPRDMGFEQLMAMTIAGTAAFYRMHPSTVNAKIWNGGSQPSLNEGSEQQQIQLAQEEGLQGDLGHLCDTFLTPMAQMVHPDLMVLAEYGQHDAHKEAQIDETRCKVDVSRNEIRIMRGRKPRGFCLSEDEYDKASDEDKAKHDDNPWNWPSDPGFASAINQAKMRDMQQQDPGAQGMDPTQGDGFGGQAGDGFGGQAAGDGQPDPAPYGTPEQGAPQGQPMAKARARTVHLHIHDDPTRYP